MLLGPINERLQSPEIVDAMAKELQALYAAEMRARQTHALAAPKELQELEGRIARLRERLKTGDPDMTTDEIQAAIDRAEAKRQELEQQQPDAKRSAKVLSILPKAAELYWRQITKGIEGDEREVLKARVFLREWFGGKISLEPVPDGGLIAHWLEHSSALLRSAGACGSGGSISLPAALVRLSLAP